GVSLRNLTADLNSVAVTNNAAGAYYNMTVDTAGTGTITVDSAVASSGSANVTLTGNAMVIGAAIGNTANTFTILNASSGAITAAGTTGNLVSGNNVLLTGNQGVGTSTNTIQTAATNLAAQAVSSGNVFVTESNGVSLRNLTADLNSVAVTNNAAGAYYNVTVDTAGTGTITVASAVATSGRANVTVTGNAIVIGAAIGNTANTFTILNARSGAITAAGTRGNLVSGNNVLLTGNQGVGTSTNTIQTAATNLAAQAVSSGNVFVTESNGVSLRNLTADLNSVAVTNNAAGAYYNVTVDTAGTGTITVASAVATSGRANVTVTGNAI